MTTKLRKGTKPANVNPNPAPEEPTPEAPAVTLTPASADADALVLPLSAADPSARWLASAARHVEATLAGDRAECLPLAPPRKGGQGAALAGAARGLGLLDAASAALAAAGPEARAEIQAGFATVVGNVVTSKAWRPGVSAEGVVALHLDAGEAREALKRGRDRAGKALSAARAEAGQPASERECAAHELTLATSAHASAALALAALRAEAGEAPEGMELPEGFEARLAEAVQREAALAVALARAEDMGRAKWRADVREAHAKADAETRARLGRAAYAASEAATVALGLAAGALAVATAARVRREYRDARRKMPEAAKLACRELDKLGN